MGIEISATTRISIIAVFVMYTIGLLGIGIYSRKSMKKTAVDSYVQEFYTGGRGFGSLVIAMMVAAGICSAGTFIGTPGTTYRVGVSWACIVCSQVLMNLCVLGVVGKKIGIVCRRNNAQSFVGLLMDRYNNSKLIGIVAALVMVVFLGFYSASQYIAGARLFEAMTGLPYWQGLALFCIVVLVIASLGGTKGAATATVFQGVVMTIAVILLLILGLNKIGNLPDAWARIAAIDNSLVEPHSLYSPVQFLAFSFLFGISACAMPHASMNALTYKNTRSLHSAIKIGILLVALWTLGILVLSCLIRAVLPELTVSDYALPTFVLAVMPGWMSGITIAGVAGALQSTVTAMVIVISASIMKDLVQTCIKPDISEKAMRKAVPITTGIIAIIIFLFALKPPDMLQFIIVFAVGGMVAGFYCPLLMGLYWRRANEYGAAAGMIGGLAYYILATRFVPAMAFGVNAIVASTVFSALLTAGVSMVTPQSPYGVIQRWFGKD